MASVSLFREKKHSFQGHADGYIDLSGPASDEDRIRQSPLVSKHTRSRLKIIVIFLIILMDHLCPRMTSRDAACLTCLARTSTIRPSTSAGQTRRSRPHGDHITRKHSFSVQSQQAIVDLKQYRPKPSACNSSDDISIRQKNRSRHISAIELEKLFVRFKRESAAILASSLRLSTARSNSP